MNLTEQQIAEALGVGAEVQEAAALQENTQPSEDNGVEVQELADPAREQEISDSENSDASQEEAEEDGEDAAAKGGGQSIEERRQNAARRREAERQAAINEAVQKAREAQEKIHADNLKQVFAGLGIKDPQTGELITSMEQFQKFQAGHQLQKLQQELKAGKLTPEGLNAMIEQHPAIRQAQQIAMAQQQAQREQAMERAKAKVDAEIAQIGKVDASIKSLKDLLEAPYGRELYAMTQRGYSLKDAHYILNRERLEQAKVEAAKQNAMHMARGKDHMTANAQSVGSGGVRIPPEELRLIRQMLPDATDAEIQAFYNQNKK